MDKRPSLEALEDRGDFIGRHIGPDDRDLAVMLAALNVSSLDELVAQTIPADEIIHDRFNCLFHPLVGISPLYAAKLAANQGLRIQENSALFFGNMSRPSGILTAPEQISDETAERLARTAELALLFNRVAPPPDPARSAAGAAAPRG